MEPSTITLIVLAVVAFLFVTELIPLAVTAMAAPIVLGFCGVLTPKQVFSGLSNSTVVLFAGMFVVGAAMLAEKSDLAVYEAVRGMLPKNSLGRAMIKKLRIYKGAEHNHAAQKPEVLTF